MKYREIEREFENISEDLEILVSLLALYNEYTDREIDWLRQHNTALAVEYFLDRRHMGDSLLIAIAEKLQFVKKLAETNAQKALEERKLEGKE